MQQGPSFLVENSCCITNENCKRDQTTKKDEHIRETSSASQECAPEITMTTSKWTSGLFGFRGRRWADMTDDDSAMSFNKSQSKVASSAFHDLATGSRWKLSNFFRRDPEHSQKIKSNASNDTQQDSNAALNTAITNKADQTVTSQFPEGFVSMMHLVNNPQTTALQPVPSAPSSQTLPAKTTTSVEVSQLSKRFNEQAPPHIACNVPQIKKISPVDLVLIGLPILESSKSFSASALQNSLKSWNRYQSSEYNDSGYIGDQWAGVRGSTTTFWSSRHHRNRERRCMRSSEPKNAPCQSHTEQSVNQNTNIVRQMQNNIQPTSRTTPYETRQFKEQSSKCLNRDSKFSISDENHENGRHVLLSNDIAHRLSESSAHRIQFGLIENSSSFFTEIYQDYGSHSDNFCPHAVEERPSISSSTATGKKAVSVQTATINVPSSQNISATDHVKNLLGVRQRKSQQQHSVPLRTRNGYWQLQPRSHSSKLYNRRFSQPYIAPLKHGLSYAEEYQYSQQLRPPQQEPQWLLRDVVSPSCLQLQRGQHSGPNHPRIRYRNVGIGKKRPPDSHLTLPVSENVKQYRMRQIAIAKGTGDYKLYLELCPKAQRMSPNEPVTPRNDEPIDCGTFNNKLLQWKREIRSYLTVKRKE